jgi:hypothetical protein
MIFFHIGCRGGTAGVEGVTDDKYTTVNRNELASFEEHLAPGGEMLPEELRGEHAGSYPRASYSTAASNPIPRRKVRYH